MLGRKVVGSVPLLRRVALGRAPRVPPETLAPPRLADPTAPRSRRPTRPSRDASARPIPSLQRWIRAARRLGPPRRARRPRPGAALRRGGRDFYRRLRVPARGATTVAWDPTRALTSAPSGRRRGGPESSGPLRAMVLTS